jgi:hypothetical protein
VHGGGHRRTAGAGRDQRVGPARGDRGHAGPHGGVGTHRAQRRVGHADDPAHRVDVDVRAAVGWERGDDLVGHLLGADEDQRKFWISVGCA